MTNTPLVPDQSVRRRRHRHGGTAEGMVPRKQSGWDADLVLV